MNETKVIQRYMQLLADAEFARTVAETSLEDANEKIARLEDEVETLKSAGSIKSEDDLVPFAVEDVPPAGS